MKLTAGTDGMANLSAHLPLGHAKAAYHTPAGHADTLHATGHTGGRTRGQIMADTLAQRITGRTTTEPTDLHLDVIITDRALLTGDTEPAHIPGHGIIPAQIARRLIQAGITADDTADTAAKVWVRRLYTAPGTGQLVALESTARLAPPGLADYIALRDQHTCRNPPLARTTPALHGVIVQPRQA